MPNSAIVQHIRSWVGRIPPDMATLWTAGILLAVILIASGCGDSRAARERQLLISAEDALSANCIDLAKVWRMHHALVAHSCDAFKQLSKTGRGDAQLLSRSNTEAAEMLEEQCRTLERLIKRSASAAQGPGRWRHEKMEMTYRATCDQLREQQKQASVVLTSAEHMLHNLRQHDSA